MPERISVGEARALLAIERQAKRRRHKYGAKPMTVDGHRFPSKFEATRYADLKLLERAGQIADLRLQPRFPLVVRGKKVGTYVGDFWYIEGRETVVEDTKGVVLPLYRLKRELFLVLYPGVVFREIRA